MQFQVPQFIETEDKIVGPFSLRQFIYVGIAGVICAVFYFFVQTWLFVLLSIIVVGSALALAFIKVGGRPLIKIVTAGAGYYWKPQSYIWKPEHQLKNASTAPKPTHSAGIPLEAIASGLALHKSWEGLQTGTPASKSSPRQLIEKKMNQRYQIFERATGERAAARRVDYR